MARPKTAAKKRRKPAPRKKAAPKPQLRLPQLPKLPELEQRHHDLIGLGLVALGAFFAFVFYLGWEGGKVGGALADVFVFLFGGVCYLVSVVLFAAGAVHVLNHRLPSYNPIRAGGV